MTNDQMREEFEPWAIEQARSMQYSFPEDAVQINGIGDYAIVWVQGAWLGWQASRAALCVELPEAELNESRAIVIDQCRTAIESTGVRTK